MSDEKDFQPVKIVDHTFPFGDGVYLNDLQRALKALGYNIPDSELKVYGNFEMIMDDGLGGTVLSGGMLEKAPETKAALLKVGGDHPSFRLSMVENINRELGIKAGTIQVIKAPEVAATSAASAMSAPSMAIKEQKSSFGGTESVKVADIQRALIALGHTIPDGEIRKSVLRQIPVDGRQGLDDASWSDNKETLRAIKEIVGQDKKTFTKDTLESINTALQKKNNISQKIEAPATGASAVTSSDQGAKITMAAGATAATVEDIAKDKSAAVNTLKARLNANAPANTPLTREQTAAMQKLLNEDFGYKLKVDGDYGPGTKKAFIHFEGKAQEGGKAIRDSNGNDGSMIDLPALKFLVEKSDKSFGADFANNPVKATPAVNAGATPAAAPAAAASAPKEMSVKEAEKILAAKKGTAFDRDVSPEQITALQTVLNKKFGYQQVVIEGKFNDSTRSAIINYESNKFDIDPSKNDGSSLYQGTIAKMIDEKGQGQSAGKADISAGKTDNKAEVKSENPISRPGDSHLPIHRGSGIGENASTQEREMVKSLQRALNKIGHQPPLVVDGMWGPKTGAAVKEEMEKNPRLASLLDGHPKDGPLKIEAGVLKAFNREVIDGSERRVAAAAANIAGPAISFSPPVAKVDVPPIDYKDKGPVNANGGITKDNPDAVADKLSGTNTIPESVKEEAKAVFTIKPEDRKKVQDAVANAAQLEQMARDSNMPDVVKEKVSGVLGTMVDSGLTALNDPKNKVSVNQDMKAAAAANGSLKGTPNRP